jgi:hypothetical protein
MFEVPSIEGDPVAVGPAPAVGCAAALAFGDTLPAVVPLGIGSLADDGPLDAGVPDGATLGVPPVEGDPVAVGPAPAVGCVDAALAFGDTLPAVVLLGIGSLADDGPLNAGVPDGATFGVPPVEDDPVADGWAPTVSGVDRGEAPSVGSETGGKRGRAEQNQPTICMPGQVSVLDAAS